MFRDVEKLKDALARGVNIVNGEKKNNTMNAAIKTLLSNGTAKFNLAIITELIKAGATFCNSTNENLNEKSLNTISVALEYSKNHILRSPYTHIANQNVIDLINYLFLDPNIRIIPESVIKLCIDYTITYIIITSKEEAITPFDLIKLILRQNIIIKYLLIGGRQSILTTTILNAMTEIMHCSGDKIIKYNKYIVDLVKLLIDHGVSAANDPDILSIAITYVVELKNQKIEDEDEMLKMIKILITNGAKPNNSSLYYQNTLSCAIKSMNKKIINMIVDLDPSPDNLGGLKDCTLTIAVDTKIIPFIIIALECGAKPDNTATKHNTLAHAICTGDSNIIQIVLIHGSEPINNNPLYRLSNAPETTFVLFYRKYIIEENNNNINNDELNHVIDLIMCSGAKFSHNLVRLIEENIKKSKIDHTHLLECMKYIFGMEYIFGKNIYYQDENKFRKQLKLTMDQLIENRTERYEIIHEIENIITSMPTCCINIIYEYRSIEPSITYIDWMNYTDWSDIH